MKEALGTRTLVLGAALALSLAAARNAEAGKALNRSLYVPIELKLCEHLEEAALYRDGLRIRRLPGKQTIQFTYYPDLKRLIPESETFQVVGEEKDGGDFQMEFVVTPSSVYIADKHIDLRVEEEMERFRHKIDIRYDPVVLELRCRHACPRRPPRVD